MKRLLVLVPLALATLLLSILWSGGQSIAQKGGGSPVTVDLDRYWIGQPETVRIQSTLGGGPDVEAWVQFTPPQWGLAADTEVPDGARVGSSWGSGNVGLDNGPCNSPWGIGFDWLDATTDTTNFFTYDPVTQPITSPAWPGYDIMPSGLERAVEQYPDFLNTMFPAIIPRARYYAHVTMGDEMVFQILVFEPVTPLPDLPPFDPADGYPALMVVQDPTAPPQPGGVTDSCTGWYWDSYFWAYSQDNGDTPAVDENGFVVRSNPPDWGNYPFNTFIRFRPDADGDGIENHLDTCPFDPNWDEDPRQGNGPDGDGLDSACDPTPNQPSQWDPTNDEDGAGANTCGDGIDNGLDGLTDIEDPDCHDIWPSDDIDGDGYLNRGDNCPLVPNGLSEDNQADDEDDGIGNACDPNPGTVDGPGQEEWWEFWVEVSGDSDLDNWSDAFERIVGSDPNNPYSYPEHLRADPAACSDGVDNDLDALVDGFDPGCDVDGDGIVNAFDACPENPEDWDGFQDADGCPDDDNDMDGVWDWDDACPNVPEDYDAFQDWDGCPDPDNDQDGFPDVTDECPGTDWTAGPDGIADSGDEPLDPSTGQQIQTKEDYDGVLDTDGCHDSPGDDYDGDGFLDELEALTLGTDPTKACALTSTANDEDPDPFPPDANDDQDTDVGDVVKLFLGKILNPPAYSPRSDFKPDGKIDVADVIRGFLGRMLTTCQPGG